VTGIKRQIEAELELIEEAGLTRSLNAPTGIDFSSNDYLGLASDPRIREAAIESLRIDTVGSTGSRLLRGERSLFRQAEKRFAKWKGTESALYFATGYQANIGIMQCLLGKDDVVLSDALNHASIIDGIRLSNSNKEVYRHVDTGHLRELLSQSRVTGKRFVVTESLFSMDGDIAPLVEIASICREFGANLIVDEAHAVGLYGARGSGLVEETGIGDDVFLTMNTAGKALGVSGAFVASDSATIRYLINKCRSFIFSTAPMPATAGAILAAIDIVESGDDLREEFVEIKQAFAGLLRAAQIAVPDEATHIVPIVIGESRKAVAVSERLQAEGFDVRAIRPPTVAAGTSRLRISLNTKLDYEVLKSFVTSLKKELGN